MTSEKPTDPLPLDKDQIPVLSSKEIPVPLREDQIPGGVSLPATTSKEDDRVTAGQRKVNLMWEATQAAIAIAVVVVTLYADARVALGAMEITTNQLAALMQLNVMMGLVVGFYFSRTNHTAIGGVGPKPQDNYVGR